MDFFKKALPYIQNKSFSGYVMGLFLLLFTVLVFLNLLIPNICYIGFCYDKFFMYNSLRWSGYGISLFSYWAILLIAVVLYFNNYIAGPLIAFFLISISFSSFLYQQSQHSLYYGYNIVEFINFIFYPVKYFYDFGIIYFIELLVLILLFRDMCLHVVGLKSFAAKLRNAIAISFVLGSFFAMIFSYHILDDLINSSLWFFNIFFFFFSNYFLFHFAIFFFPAVFLVWFLVRKNSKYSIGSIISLAVFCSLVYAATLVFASATVCPYPIAFIPVEPIYFFMYGSPSVFLLSLIILLLQRRFKTKQLQMRYRNN